MMRRFVGVLVAVLSLVAAPAAAQDPPPPPPGPPAETELVFEREVFQYPQFTVRNPFKALVAADAGGPRYDQLRLSGIIFSEDPSRSVAVFNTANVTVNEDGTLSAEDGESFYAKVGQTIGNVTIIEITLEYVVVDVEEFGLADRKIMRPLNLLGGNQ